MAFLRDIGERMFVALVALAWTLPGFGQTKPPAEYQIKAVFLYNFAQFVEWPPEAFREAGAPLIIGVLGEDPFGGYLDEVIRGEKVKNRRLEVQRFRSAEAIDQCHVLFISRSEGEQVEQIIEPMKARPMLTVGDTTGFAQRGGMIRFVTEQGRVRLRINLEAVKRAKLTVSSKLLRPATIVAPGED